MPLQTVKQQSFFTFGTGLLIGFGTAMSMRATMPRATEVIGLMMQKMGFELGDILLALWDPEAQQADLVLQVAALPAPKKKQPLVTKKAIKPTRRKNKAPVPKLPRPGRTVTPAKMSSKTHKLPFSRRHFRSSTAVRLN